MKPIIVLVLALVVASAAAAGEGWTLQPRISAGKLLPGATIEAEPEFFPFLDAMLPPRPVTYRYEGTSVDLAVRALPPGPGWLALTFGGGVTWYYRGDEQALVMPAADGIGRQLAPGDFVAFPVTVGVQAVYPRAGWTDFMLFAGLEGSAVFVSGDVPMDQQLKGGYGLKGGFAVRVFELGVEYRQFSDMKNLGVYLGVRLNPFTVGGGGPPMMSRRRG